MAAPNLAAQLQKRIILYSALGILVTGLLVGLAGIMPLVMQLRDAQVQRLQSLWQSQNRKVEEFVAQAKQSAAGRGPRQQVREMLAAYAANRITREELQRGCRDWIDERLGISTNTVGLAVLDPRGEVLAEGGEPVPPEHRRFPPGADAEPSLSGPYLKDGRPLLVVAAQVTSGGDTVVGGVVALRRIAPLQRIVTDYAGFGRSGETILGDPGNIEHPVFFGYRPGRQSVLVDSAREAAVRKALRLAGAMHQPGVLLPPDLDGAEQVIVCGPVEGTSWVVLVRMNREELFAPINRRLVSVGVVLGGVLLLGTAGMVIMLRPMAGRMIVHTDELESQVYEKTAALNTELGERLRAERSLRDSEALYHSLVDTLPISILRKDLQGRVTYGNRGYAEKMGRPLAELLGKTDFELFPRDLAEKYLRDDQQVIQGGKIFEDVEEHRSADGAPSYVHVLKAPVRDAGGKVVGTQVIFWDVTARKLAEEALARTAADLARSNRELEQFAYVASHDLQEPLRMVTSYTQLTARRYADKLDTDAREFMQFAVNGALRMQRLIQDLLAYSRVGTRGKAFEPVDLNEVLAAARDNLRLAIEEAGAVVSVDPLPRVMGDGVQLVQLLQNLIGNALKFRGAQPTRIEVRCRRQAASSCSVEGGAAQAVALPDEWILSVADNGIGIDPQYFEKIFVIFQRLHTHDQYPGTGIGLAICKKIAERHGGRIWVESEAGHGSIFLFSLPVAAQLDGSGTGAAIGGGIGGGAALMVSSATPAVIANAVAPVGAGGAGGVKAGISA
jgi:PAS domain S-box-containing protein